MAGASEYLGVKNLGRSENTAAPDAPIKITAITAMMTTAAREVLAGLEFA